MPLILPGNSRLIDRRLFLSGVAGVSAAAALAAAPATKADAASSPARSKDDPFTLGVASGDPTPSGVVLWTRLAPKPFEPNGGMPPGHPVVEWRLATDAGMRNVVRDGSAHAPAQLGHSVHVEVEGLEPDCEYFYEFKFRNHWSPVGRTKTLPAPGADVRQLDFAFASCQKWDDGFFPSYRHMAVEDLDFVVHLGDYVYEYEIGADGGLRRTPVPAAAQPAPQTLEQWRARYALYKSDPDLQAAHARFPFIVTWDDHEVQNDYAGGWEGQTQAFTAVRAAAYMAYYEHQPLRARSLPRGTDMQLYRRLRYGRLAQLDVLDGRQYRDAPPCGWGEAQACEAAYDPAISMLGSEQEQWLYAGLRDSGVRWNILGNNVMVSRLDHDGAAGELLWHDAWDGFPAARKRLLDVIAEPAVRNAVFVTGDWHSTFVNDVHLDFDRQDSPVVATEFVGTSISTNGDVPVYGPYYEPMIGFNPHIKFFDGDRRGYVRCQVTPERWRTELRMATGVGSRTAGQYTHAVFEVEDGAPGAVRVS
ncbi:MAG TPA: alkaline phosphatase D family protein [Arthrobacter sp.]|nr:alkaline phosphatase D family protein [Arthrobacter sp.]